MRFAPLTHAFNIGRTTEMIAVARFAQPAAVALGVPGSTALWFGAEALMPCVPQVGIKQLFAMQTLTLIRIGHLPA
jgi:hypothetical protein